MTRRVIQVARAEVRDRTWALTRQFLGSRAVLLENGEPVIARVAELEPGRSLVYIPLEERGRHHLVIAIREAPAADPEVIGVAIEADVRVYLRIASPVVTGTEITSRLGLTPTRIEVRGEPRPYTPALICDMHRWVLEPQAGIPGHVEEKLEALFQAIRPSAGEIATLSQDCSVEVQVVYDGWRGDPQFGGWTVAKEHTAFLAQIGASIDFDLYATGPGELNYDER
jgi:hypothetical protein